MADVGSSRTSFARPTEISPLHAYIGLKSMFGEPNREYIDEDKQQWVFLLKTTNAKLEVNDWKLGSWSVHVYEENGDEARAEKILNELVQQATRAALKHRKAISELLQSPPGHILENPFSLYLQTAVDLLELARKSKTPFGEGNQFSDWMAQYSLCRAAFFQFIACMEGFLNLVYEVFLKPELRDERIMERLAREQIDIKLRLAPIYCTCFTAKPIDHTTDAFRDFLRLVNARNDFIHANITKAMKTAIVVHENTTFLVAPENSKSAGVAPTLISSIGVEDLDRTHVVITAIVEQITSSMKPRFRKQFRSVMNEEYINVEYRNGIPHIITETDG